MERHMAHLEHSREMMLVGPLSWIDVLWTVNHPLNASDGRILDVKVDNVSRGQLLGAG